MDKIIGHIGLFCLGRAMCLKEEKSLEFKT